MGIKLFSSSSSDKSYSLFSKWLSKSNVGGGNTSQEQVILPNPKPDNYKIIRNETVEEFRIIEIQYLDCTNYEGRKILIFENCTIHQLTKQKLIDPHFSENKKFLSPIARFEPTEKGWEYAKSFCFSQYQ